MNFAERMREVIRKNLIANNILVVQALEDADNFQNNANLEHEINHLEKNLENIVLRVGNEVYTLLIKKKQSTLSKNTGAIKDLLLEIMKLEKQIMEKELLLKQNS
jgi:hypothetical protein